MPMSTPAQSPDAYVALQQGWVRECVEHLRASVRSVKGLEETLKWGHLVYVGEGPVLLIRAETQRVLLGFWRGQRLLEIEPGLKPGGKYEMATLHIAAAPYPTAARVKTLVRRAIQLNQELGNPQHAAGPSPLRASPCAAPATRTAAARARPPARCR